VGPVEAETRHAHGGFDRRKITRKSMCIGKGLECLENDSSALGGISLSGRSDGMGIESSPVPSLFADIALYWRVANVDDQSIDEADKPWRREAGPRDRGNQVQR
jgi:hypothetical protein